MNNRASRGFTLIELLVVIAIIAILAAILFPVYMSAKQNAIRTSCLSNMKQMGSAIIQYADDNSGFLPDCVTINSMEDNVGVYDINRREKLHMRVLKYVKNRKLFFCPADRTNPTCFDRFGASYQNYSWFDTVQRDNYPWPHARKSDLYGMPWPVPLGLIPVASKAGLVRDAMPWHFTPDKYRRWQWNKLFADGHVKTVRGASNSTTDPFEDNAGIY